MLGHASPLRTAPPPAGHRHGLGHLSRRRPTLWPGPRGLPPPVHCGSPAVQRPRRGSVALTRLLPDETDTQPTTPLAPPSALTVTTRALVPRRAPSRLTPRPLPPGPQRSGSPAGSLQLEDLCFKKQLRFLRRRKENTTQATRVQLDFSTSFSCLTPAPTRVPVVSFDLSPVDLIHHCDTLRDNLWVPSRSLPVV